MGDYKLSASLQGHEDDVRSVAYPIPGLVLSASRDATVRLWRLAASKPPTYDCTLSSHGSSFVNAVAFIPPTAEFPDGLVVSGGKDTIIEVRQPSKAPHDNADALLLGHQGNVCALDVSEDQRLIISGGWDASARVWPVGKWESSTVLQGHEASVWAVLAYDRETILTGCADKLIRVFHPSGKLLRSIRGTPDVVRALCKLPSNHSTGAQFASAGNDAVIRLWTLEGLQVAELHGHENFIYSLAALPTGELVSSSEDRTVRIWKDTTCVQTITHPAISVWSVAVCRENGDIVTGASDRIVRVFSRSPDRHADEATTQAFTASVQQSSIPQQAVGDVNKEKLPGPDFLTSKSGTKEGQVQMITELNGNVSAYQWSTAANQWLHVGTVVDAAGSSGRKITYDGKDYDYVFDVDIEDGKPPLKLPYNLSQNPYEAARKFIGDNELPITYLDQVANFITTNTQGATLGQQGAPQSSDPWGTGSRYRPGEVDAPAPSQTPAKPPKVLPQTAYLNIATASFKPMEAKIKSFNQELLDLGSKDVSLNPADLEILSATLRQLEEASQKPASSSPALGEGVDLALRIATQWPQDKRLPGLDMLRLLAVFSPALAQHSSAGDKTIIDLLADSGVFESNAPANNTMLAVRVLANLFNTEEGRLITEGAFDQIHQLVQPLTKSENRNTILAVATVYINFAVQLTKPAHNADRALSLLQDLTDMINTVKDSEAMYRALVAAGTCLSLGEDFRQAAKEVFDFEIALARAEKISSDPRIKRVITEMRDELA